MKSYSFVALLTALSFLAVLNVPANAQDGYGYGHQNVAPSQQVAPQAQDNYYSVPPAYQGQYYPQETQGAVGYYGTQDTSSNTAAEDDYYYYYY